MSAQATNVISSGQPNSHVTGGDNNSINGSPANGQSGYAITNIINGYDNVLNDTWGTMVFGQGNSLSSSDITLSGQGNVVWGGYGVISGDVNHVTASLGGTINLIGSGNTSIGNDNNIFGNSANIQSYKVNATGNSNTVFSSPDTNIYGNRNTVKDLSSLGDTGSSDDAFVGGNDNTIISGPHTVTIGSSNTNTGTVNDSYGMMIGYGNTMTNALNGTIIGTGSTATGANSIVIGSGASASNGAIAIGADSVANRSNTVSFGSSGAERQLTNVAAGTADTDVSNVKQMRDADAATLSSAKGYTDARETVINSRMDSLIAQEKSDRITGDADTLAKSGDYTDKQTAAAISTANSYTDSREQAINSRTDGLVADEASKRIAGDADTLNAANSYTSQRETAINTRTDQLMDNEQQARVEGDRRTLSSANSYTNQRFSELNNKVNRNERRANGGISAAMAMSSIPYQIYVDNSFGMAAGTYRGETALAAGLQKQIAPTANVRLNVSWDTANSVGVAGGFAVGW
ncbi:YadA-like family protein [Klebsiella pneumoniae]|nr:YadA-like family protein [Klebsiella pneumoniae]EKZ9716714.1 YadA-like family protein [Klebsiella pneumoniae]